MQSGVRHGLKMYVRQCFVFSKKEISARDIRATNLKLGSVE